MLPMDDKLGLVPNFSQSNIVRASKSFLSLIIEFHNIPEDLFRNDNDLEADEGHRR